MLEKIDENTKLNQEKGTIFKEKQSRGEKKTKKALQSFFFEKVNHVSHVKFQKNTNATFLITQPEVFRSINHNSFLIFGEAKIENIKSSCEK